MRKKKREEIVNPFIDNSIDEIIDEAVASAEETSEEIPEEIKQDKEVIEDKKEDSFDEVSGLIWMEYVSAYLAKQNLDLDKLKKSKTPDVGYIGMTVNQIGICHDGSNSEFVMFQTWDSEFGGVKIERIKTSKFLKFLKV